MHLAVRNKFLPQFAMHLAATLSDIYGKQTAFTIYDASFVDCNRRNHETSYFYYSPTPLSDHNATVLRRGGNSRW